MNTKKDPYLFTPISSFRRRHTNENNRVKKQDVLDRNHTYSFQRYVSYGNQIDQLLEEEEYIPHEILNDYKFPILSMDDIQSSFPIVTECPDLEKKKENIIGSKWGGYALDIGLWENEKSPIVKLKYANELIELESNGFLSDRLIGIGSTFLTTSPENGLYILSKYVMRNMGLKNISLLYYHRYLQYIDISYNELAELTALGGIPYLMYLNASHNSLKDVLNFTPPWYLTYVNLSHNTITEIRDLSSFWSIIRLDLSHNAIEEICGLQNLKYLQYLNLSHNLIEHIENLNNLNIQELNLEANHIISSKENGSSNCLKTLASLRTLILGYNKLTKLDFLKDTRSLRLVDLRYNKIADLLEVSHIKGMVYELDLRGNPCTEWPNYRYVLLFSIPTVMFMDGTEVSVEEKVSATTLFAPPLKLLAARSCVKLTLLEQLNVPKIGPHVIPYDKVKPPLIVLTGPSAVKKRTLGIQIALAIPNIMKYCKWYTTKELETDKKEEISFTFVEKEEFEKLARHGDFLAIHEFLGHRYGLHMEEIVSLALEQKIGITQADLHSTMQILNRYQNVKPVLVFTRNIDLHRIWIQDKFNVYVWLRNSIKNVLAIKIGEHLIEDLETKSSIFNFIHELVEAIVDELDLPTYIMSIRPQGTGATATDIIYESRTMLPKITKARSEFEIEDKEKRRSISFEEEGRRKSSYVSSQQSSPSEVPANLRGLRVILDEEANIIIDDVTANRKKELKKLLRRRAKLGKDFPLQHSLSLDDFIDSTSSEEMLIDLYETVQIDNPDELKEVYTELVLQTRPLYLEQHENNPGFFSLIILTDDYPNAFKTLKNYIRELYLKLPFQEPEYTPEIKHLLNVAIPDNAYLIMEEMKELLSTSKIQHKILLREYNLTSWKDLMPSQR